MVLLLVCHTEYKENKDLSAEGRAKQFERLILYNWFPVTMMPLGHLQNLRRPSRSRDLQAAVLCRGVMPDVVLPLKFHHDFAELLKCLKCLFGFLNGELGVFFLLPLRTLVHRHAGTSIFEEETGHHDGYLTGRLRIW